MSTADRAVAAAALPAPEPAVNPETEPYWSAAAQGRLVLPRCRSCDTTIWYPRRFCPSCAGTEIDWVPSPGLGQVYSYTVVRRGEGAYRQAVPYVLAYVELDEGPRVLTNIVDCDPEQVRIGLRVSAVHHPAGPAAALLRFRPA